MKALWLVLLLAPSVQAVSLDSGQEAIGGATGALSVRQDRDMVKLLRSGLEKASQVGNVDILKIFSNALSVYAQARNESTAKRALEAYIGSCSCAQSTYECVLNEGLDFNAQEWLISDLFAIGSFASSLEIRKHVVKLLINTYRYNWSQSQGEFRIALAAAHTLRMCSIWSYGRSEDAETFNMISDAFIRASQSDTVPALKQDAEKKLAEIKKQMDETAEALER